MAAVKRQLEEILAIPAEEAIEASAKMGIGIEEILEAVVERIPAPAEPEDLRLRALVFDSIFDAYRGVVSYVRVFSGRIKRGNAIRMVSNGNDYEVKKDRHIHPETSPASSSRPAMWAISSPT